MVTTYYCISPLSNLIGRVNLLNIGPGFQIYRWNFRKIVQLLSKLLNISPQEIESELFYANCFRSKRKYIFVAVNEFRLKSLIDNNKKSILRWHKEIEKKYQQIDMIFSLIRLRIGGNARPYGTFFYTIENKKIFPSSSFQNLNTGIGYPSKITQYSAELINQFIKSKPFPMKYEYLQLAFDNLELSKQIDIIQIQFLCLMIGLEAIFNMGAQEIVYRVSRNAAVLLGDDKDSSEQIMKEIKSLYEKRSILIHTGKSNKISRFDVLTAENYVRDSILALLKLDISKDDLSKVLTRSGFSQLQQ